jgi:heme-degrading monooxygenase HmoA
MTISRVWRGWAAPERAAEYERMVCGEVIPGMGSLDGYRGASLRRRETEDGEVEFLVLTEWDSLEAIRGFAGEDYEAATIPAEAEALLTRFDPRAVHYGLVEEWGGSRSGGEGAA